MKPLNWKKNFFSYAAWFVCLILTGYGAWILAGLWLSESGVSGNAALYVTFAGVLLLAGLLNVFVWLIRKRKRGFPSGSSERQVWLGSFLEMLLGLAVFAAGMYLRWEKIPFADGAGYFEMAEVRLGEGMPLLLHGASHLYLLCLHGICFVLGNSLFFCVWFHLILQALAGILCLLGIRRLTGGFSALLFAVYYFLNPGMIDRAVTLGPEPFALLVFGIGLLAAGGFLRKTSGLFLGYFLTGSVIALAAYLDISGLVLLGILLTVFTVERGEPENFWNRRTISFLTAMAGFGAAFAGCFALDACFSGISVKRAALAWSSLYLTAGNPAADPLKLILGMRGGREAACVLFGILFLGIFSFFFKKRQERICVWVIAGGILFLLEYFGMTAPAVNGGQIFLLCLCALAGAALSNYGRESVLEKAQMRKWDPSLYGIVEDNAVKDISERAFSGQYSEGEDGDNGSAGPDSLDGGYAEGEYCQEERNADSLTEGPGMKGRISEERDSAGEAAVREKMMDGMTDREDQDAGNEAGGNFITRIFAEKNRRKEQQRQEMERVLSALSAISEDAEVSISPDHKPGEELVKGPARGGAEKPAETAGPDGGKKKKKGLRKNKAGAAEGKVPLAAKTEPEVQGEKAVFGTMDDGRSPLHNPLPVPKKKTATMLDYDYEVSDDDDYDYD